MYTSNNVTLHYYGNLYNPKIASVFQCFENKLNGKVTGFERVNSSNSKLSVSVKVESTYRSKLQTFVMVTLESGETFLSPYFISISKPKSSKQKDMAIHKNLPLVLVQPFGEVNLPPVQTKGTSRLYKEDNERNLKRKREDSNEQDTKKPKSELEFDIEGFFGELVNL